MLINFIKYSRLIHNISSFVVNLIPFFIFHNLSKYNEIRKALFNLGIDSIEGDYLEFGVFTGSTINHALNIYSKTIRKYKQNRKFYGFDSFEGFPEEVHSEFTSKKFQSDYNFVKKLEKKHPVKCKIIKGYFEESLQNKELENEITNIALVFIDCDIYKSAIPCIKFIKKKLSHGSYIIVDDCHNIDQNGKSILNALEENLDVYNNLRLIGFYGVSGMIYRYFKSTPIN